MAIHQDHPGLTVEIMANGEPLQEYDDASEEKVPGEVTKYIEARSGVEFMIRYKFAAPFSDKKDVGCLAMVDGQCVVNQYINRGELLKLGHFYSRGVRVKGASGLVLQNFAFANLRVSKFREPYHTPT
jgi:hypothetical protein